MLDEHDPYEQLIDAIGRGDAFPATVSSAHREWHQGRPAGVQTCMNMDGWVAVRVQAMKVQPMSTEPS